MHCARCSVCKLLLGLSVYTTRLIGVVVPFRLKQFQILPTLLAILAEVSGGICRYSYDNVF